MSPRLGRRSDRLPWPALLLAVIAISFFTLPLAGLIWRAPWPDAGRIPHGDAHPHPTHPSSIP